MSLDEVLTDSQFKAQWQTNQKQFLELWFDPTTRILYYIRDRGGIITYGIVTSNFRSYRHSMTLAPLAGNSPASTIFSDGTVPGPDLMIVDSILVTSTVAGEVDILFDFPANLTLESLNLKNDEAANVGGVAPIASIGSNINGAAIGTIVDRFRVLAGTPFERSLGYSLARSTSTSGFGLEVRMPALGAATVFFTWRWRENRGT